MRSLLIFVGLLFLAVPLTARAETAFPADLVITNGRLWRVQPASEAEALAVWRGRIVAVGSSADVKPFIGPKTRVLDLQGKRVVPGFHDSHVHLLGSGLRLAEVQLKDAENEAAF